MSIEKWESACRKKGMTPAEKVVIPEGVIFFAEGFKDGKFLGSFCVSRGGLDIGYGPMEFAWDHDMDLTPEDRKRARINALKKEAFKWVGLNVETGRYDA